MPDFADRLYQQCDPVRPLEAHETNLYVNWQEEVGLEDVKRSLVNAFARAGDHTITRLLSGHRGVGKTTELFRVAERLRQGVRGNTYFVSMLRGEQWLDLEDIRAEDVIFQVIRQLVSDLTSQSEFGVTRQRAGEWGKAIIEWLKQAQVDVGGDWLSVSLTLKDFPSGRSGFREMLRGQLPSLIDRVNDELLSPATQHLARTGINGGVVLIVDDLDRIPQQPLPDRPGVTNQEQLFLHEGALLRSLSCDMLYTIPIELAYSPAQNQLVNTYGGPILSLPVIPVRNEQGQPEESGRAALRQIYEHRVTNAGGRDEHVFADEALIERALDSTGGHVRSLFILLRTLLDQTDALPFDAAAVDRALANLRRDMRRSLDAHGLTIIEQVAQTESKLDDPEFAQLLRGGYIQAFMDNVDDWYRPHPWLGVEAP